MRNGVKRSLLKFMLTALIVVAVVWLVVHPLVLLVTGIAAVLTLAAAMLYSFTGYLIDETPTLKKWVDK